MSRISLGAVCVSLALAGFVLGDRLGAQQEEAATAKAQIRSAGNAVQNAENRIDAVLDKKLEVPLDFIDTSLIHVVAELQEEYELPILFDNSALEEVAISPDTEITISLHNVTLRSALELILRQPGLEDLTTIIDEEVLLITTQDRANANLLVEVYRVDDFEHFVYDAKQSDSKANCYSPLHDVIVSCVEFDSWQENGTGEGSIFLMKPGLLVVSQTRSVHQEIKELLADLREAKAEIEGGESGSDRY